MPTIINPMRADTTIGDSIARAAAGIFGGDRIGPAIKREKLLAAQRENVMMQELMKAVGGSGPLDFSQLGPALIGSGFNPGQFNDFALGRAANQFGASDPRTQAAQVGAGGPFSATADAFESGLGVRRRGQDLQSADRRRGQDIGSADRRFEFNNKPLEAMVNGEPGFIPQQGAFASGVEPFVKPSTKLTPEQEFDGFAALWLRENPGDFEGAKNFAMAQAAKRGNGLSVTTPDGTQIQMGGIGGLTKAVTSDEQKTQLSLNRFRGLVKEARGFLEDPTLFGLAGRVRGAGQSAVQLLSNMAQVFGSGSPDDLVQDTRRELVQSGVSPQLLPELFDPNLPAVDTVWGIMVYQGAAALAGQSGRSVSDRDVKIFKDLIGDPKAVFSSAATLGAKLDIIEDILDVSEDTGRAALGGQPLPDNTTPAAPVAPAQGPGPGFGIPSPGDALEALPLSQQLNDISTDIDALVNKYRSK